jgi:hypothetical protein
VVAASIRASGVLPHNVMAIFLLLYQALTPQSCSSARVCRYWSCPLRFVLTLRGQSGARSYTPNRFRGAMAASGSNRLPR